MTVTPPLSDLPQGRTPVLTASATGAAPGREQDAWLSALADGEATAADRACSAWRDDAQARATWHAYQLIGDALRSDELVTPPGHDAAFLTRLRLRMATEPVPLAPAPLPGTGTSAAVSATGVSRRRQVWLSSAAIAAGFVAVAGVLVVTRTAPVDGEGTWLARGNNSGQTSSGLVPASPTMLRNAGLDRYLEAHRGLPGLAPGIAAGGGLRSVDAVVPLPSLSAAPTTADRASAAPALR